ncbi:MAG: hypothetical protein V4726_18890 [Verrucomicrobiota bacterium]
MNEKFEPADEPGKRGTWKWLLTGALLLILTTLAVLLLSDERLRPYDDLLPPQVAVPDAGTNGYLYLKKRWEYLPARSSRERERLTAMTSGKEPADAAFLSKLRKGHENTVQEWRSALAMPEWRQPSLTGDLSEDSVSWMMSPLRLFIFDAMTSLRSGDAAPAVTLQEEMALWVHRHLESGGGLASVLVTVSIQSITAELGCEVLASAKPDAVPLEAISSLWREERDFAAAWQTAMRNEGVSFRSVVDSTRSGGTLRQRWLLKKNKTLNAYHEIVRKVMAASFQSFPTLKAAQEAGLGDQPQSDSPLLGRWDPNATGDRLLNGTRLLGKLAPVLPRALFVPRAMRVRLAIYRWRQAHPGQWPVSLTELVPDYLPEVPKDPWNDGSLLWDQATRTVYAVGADWKPALPVFKRDNRSWLAPDSEAQGLRMELPSPPPASAPPERRIILGTP